MNYKIKSPVDIESISDELAGYSAAVRVTQTATIQVIFDNDVDKETREHIDSVMIRLGAEPVAA